MTLEELRLITGIADHSRTDKKTILVVEDDLAHHSRLVRWLQSEGLSPIGLVEVTSLSEDAIEGCDGEGESQRIALESIRVAFLDYYFPRPPFNGGLLAQTLSAAGVRCFGMSSVADKNETMKMLGAIGAMRKREMAALIARA